MSKIMKFPFDGKYVTLKATATGLAISVDGGTYQDLSTGGTGSAVEALSRTEYDAATKDIDTVYVVDET